MKPKNDENINRNILEPQIKNNKNGTTINDIYLKKIIVLVTTIIIIITKTAMITRKIFGVIILLT